jgi:biopolymer transport protein TolR
MLVLIIIFMITAPMLNVGIQVDLPKTQAASLNETKSAPIIVSIDGDSKIFIEEAEVSIEDLVQKLPMILDNGKSDTVYVRGDKNLQYGKVMEIMGIISTAGACKVSLISDPDISSSNIHVTSKNQEKASKLGISREKTGGNSGQRGR